MAAVTSKDNITTSTVDDGMLRGLGQLSLTAAPSETYCDEGHSESTLRGLLERFEARELCDVTLITGECRISAHRIMLASCSRYFKAMFTVPMKEARLTEVPLGNVDSQALQALVRYCYTGNIELRADTAEMLLSTANRMEFQRVANACSAYMQRHLDPGNCLRLALFAEHEFCEELHEAALKYTFRHLLEVAKQQEFLALQPDQLTSLLTSGAECIDAVTVQSAFESLIAWVQHDRSNREQHLAAALKLLKLHLLPTEYLLNDVAHACSHAPDCLLSVMDALRRRQLAEPPAASAPTASAPSGTSGAAVGWLCAIGGSETGPMSIEMYSAEINSWSPVKGVKGAVRRCFGAAVLHGRVIVVGGLDSQGSALNTVESFELSNTMHGDWSTLAPLNKRRCYTSAAALGDGPDAAVYVVGGWNASDDFLRSVERWDARAGAWTLVAPMRDARYSCGVAALRGRLYAVGGYNGRRLKSVECYDPNTDRWSDCAPMSCARSSVSVCAAGGYLYAIGGWDGYSALASVERYDPVADTWATAAPLSRARYGVASCLMGDRIVAVGGRDGSRSDQRTVEVYDSASDSWQELAPLHTARSFAALVCVPPC